MNNDELMSLVNREKEVIRKEEEQKKNVTTDDNLNLINQGIQTAVVEKIRRDESVQSRMLNTADKMIDSKLNSEKSKAETEEKKTHAKNNADACDLYGINEDTVPKWVVNIAALVQDFWYMIWLVVGSVTTAPIVFLSKKINVIFKKTWVCVLLAITIYLMVLITPLIINYIKIWR